jgi:hypothetical protein
MRIAQLDILSASKGHDKEVIQIKDDDPEKRKKLSQRILALVKDGFQVFLADGSRVKGYDPESNEWLVAPGPKSKEMRRTPAENQVATAVAPASGG